MGRIVNLDEGIEESVEFVLSGIHYRLRYLNIEEMESFSQLDQENPQISTFIDLLKPLVTNVNEGEQEFEQTFRKVSIPKVKKFMQLIKDELSESDSPEDTQKIQ